MDQILSGKKILVLVANGVDETVMTTVQRDMAKTGATVKTVGIEPGLVNSWNNNTWGMFFPVDLQITTTLGSDYDCLIVPSGSKAVAKLSGSAHSERIISSFIEAGKQVAFIGDAVELLAKTNMAKGWKVAGPDRVQAVMTAAGAEWQGSGDCVHNIVLTGEAVDVSAFVSVIVNHFTDEVEIKAAA